MTDRATPDRAAAPAPLAERLAKLMAKATALPWESRGEWNVESTEGQVATFEMFEDRELIVAIVNNLPTLLATLDGREAGWLPIESAPRDGTWFLACATEPGWGATRIVRFDEPDDRLPIHGEGNIWPSAPTHWRLLPAPPARPRCPQSGAPEPAGEPE